jgi:hypothetical protein
MVPGDRDSLLYGRHRDRSVIAGVLEAAAREGRSIAVLRGQPNRQQPPVELVAHDRGRRQDLPGRVVERLRASREGLDEGQGSGGAPDPSEVHPLFTEEIRAAFRSLH